MTTLFTPQNAPRDLAGIQQMSDSSVYRLALSLRIFKDNEEQEQAFLHAPKDEQRKTIYEKLQEYDQNPQAYGAVTMPMTLPSQTQPQPQQQEYMTQPSYPGAPPAPPGFQGGQMPLPYNPQPGGFAPPGQPQGGFAPPGPPGSFAPPQAPGGAPPGSYAPPSGGFAPPPTPQGPPGFGGAPAPGGYAPPGFAPPAPPGGGYAPPAPPGMPQGQTPGQPGGYTPHGGNAPATGGWAPPGPPQQSGGFAPPQAPPGPSAPGTPMGGPPPAFGMPAPMGAPPGAVPRTPSTESDPNNQGSAAGQLLEAIRALTAEMSRQSNLLAGLMTLGENSFITSVVIAERMQIPRAHLSQLLTSEREATRQLINQGKA